MSYKSVLAKSVNPELLVPLALAGMFAVAAAAFAAVMLPLPAAAEAMGTFTANNSVQPGGIHPVPGQTTGGNGLVEAKFAVDFAPPSPRPIVPPGTVFPAGFTDVQTWNTRSNVGVCSAGGAGSGRALLHSRPDSPHQLPRAADQLCD